jgi:GntR family transcriptional regulator of arabinose operon
MMVERSIRNRIIRGQWKPAQQISTRHELMAEFGVSMITVQRAIDALADDGFLVARGRAGTFVRQQPPHLTNYAVVFFSHPNDPHTWGRFWQAIATEASVIERDSDRKMPRFYDINGHADSEDYQKLLRDVKSERLAGVIFASKPGDMFDTPYLDLDGLPCVAISAPLPGMTMPAIEVHGFGVVERAVEYLAGRGRRRIALLAKSSEQSHDSYLDVLLPALERHGASQPPYWRQFLDFADREAVINATHMLVQRNQDPRPDALIVGDDSLFDAAVAGLINAGVRVPQEVEVVTHCNFPFPTESAVPVTRLGFDIRRVMATCIESIDLQRRGEPAPRHVMIPAQFEHEIERVHLPASASPINIRKTLPSPASRYPSHFKRTPFSED